MPRRFSALLFLAVTAVLSACFDKNDPSDSPDPVISEILPESFSVDIPTALSASTGPEGGRLNQNDEVRGEDIYNNLRGFIWVGESSTEILADLFEVILQAELDTVLAFSITSEDDGRVKDFQLRQRVTRERKDFRYELNVFDNDGSRAAQILWNLKTPEVLAILNPYNLNRNQSESLRDVHIRIDYTEDDPDYDESMLVSIAGLPESEGIDNLMMFVGKDGDLIEIFGNSNHPDILLIDQSFTGGRNYAFVARGEQELDIGVAAIGLPPSAVDTDDDLLVEYSILSVFEEELNAAGVTDQELIDQILKNAHAPGYFIGDQGFVSSGVDVPQSEGFNSDFIDLQGLTPFVPRDIRDLEVNFLDN